MKGPWTDKTGLAKWVAIFSTSLGIATGLCGLNFVGVLFLVPMGGGIPPAKVTGWDWIHGFITGVLTVGAYAEVLVIGISLAALFVLAVVMIVRQLMAKGSE